MSGLLTPATFEPHVGTEFAIEVPGGNPVVVLGSVNRLAARSHGDRTEPFSLLFLGPGGGPLAQATYTLRHSHLGELQVFLVPIGPNAAGGQQYEAVFN
jgi:hypothetical protein